jgi:hypothetical protein
MTTQDYITSLNSRYQRGNATEHTYRGDLQLLLESLIPGIEVTNEPQRQACGAPDYVVSRKDIPLGFIEAKNINDNDLEGKKTTGNKEQFVRYRSALNNLIITDYLNFHFYDNGELMTKVCIGTIENGVIVPENEGIKTFELLFSEFCNYVGQTIKSPQKLALMMAGKAKLLANIINNALISDEENQQNSSLREQMLAFKEILIHDIKPAEFADVYAQTITYGLFAARLHDPTLEDFSRHEAAELIPKSNPFLRKLFGYIAGPDIDSRILWVVDNLIEVFLACNVEEVLQNYGKSTKMEDPIIHFYETFLSEYNPKLRKARGVWYTPQPVVDFIVRAVDDILKDEFGLKAGLADTSKTKIKVNTDNRDKRSASGYKTVEKEVHKVQILDPATGTGTFLAEVIKHIHKRFKGQAGIWNSYVQEHLIPRVNGFELLMASYAMAHLKLDLLLRETGYTQKTNDRLRVYLTNSLEESHPDTGTLFANWLSSEANEANRIKRDSPVMCVIGNPPYSGISSNNGEWISNLIEDYKYVDGVHFKERKHWLNDDYVKFLRYGQHFIEKNGSGVLAYINPHGFLDNPTFRGMRWHLLKTYDKIYTIDLHGNSKKKETAPDGSADVNVFDIQQGVSINLFIKTGKKKANELGTVFHYDLFGKRELKYDFLSGNSLKDVDFKELPKAAPNYFFVPKDFKAQKSYEKGFKINELFNLNNTGIVTGIDRLSIFQSEKELIETFEDILSKENPFDEYKIKDTRRTTKEGRVNELRDAYAKGVVKFNYRPFDLRYSLEFSKNEHWINSPRTDVMKHFTKGENIGLICPKQVPERENAGAFLTRTISGHKTCSAYNINNIFPLYLYPLTDGQQTLDDTVLRTPNLNQEIVNEIGENLGLMFTGEKESTENTFAPIDILDYIYAVLHSPSYREKYKEFLKIDFPRIPYPKNQESFWQLVELGGEIRNVHLLESETVEDYITQYPIQGSNEVVKPIFKDCRVHINDEQYFDNVPQLAWEFYIGGYQPAQKWLKDRKGRELSFEDIMHYQKIIVSLTETYRLMEEIDKVIDLN